MGIFKTKQSTLDAKISAVDERIAELQKRAAGKEKDVATARETLGQRIADGAARDDEKVNEQIRHSRQAVQRTQDAFDELKLQIEVLGKQRAALELDRKRAMIDETPGRLVNIAGVFNKSLEAAVTKLAELKALYGDLLKAQGAYHDLMVQRQQAMTALGVTEGLEIPEGGGLGLLAHAETPFRGQVQIPDNEVAFLREMISYRQPAGGLPAVQGGKSAGGRSRSEGQGRFRGRGPAWAIPRALPGSQSLRLNFQL